MPTLIKLGELSEEQRTKLAHRRNNRFHWLSPAARKAHNAAQSKPKSPSKPAASTKPTGTGNWKKPRTNARTGTAGRVKGWMIAAPFAVGAAALGASAAHDYIKRRKTEAQK